ncbi:DUF3488 and transglutaminase-like domain-containing protein [Methylonatrum kenyense]|uniref:transglutaminase TgpA family protein n=1 Tax=Methylonatrum kenyense TaxID=455253 RepID=UPI0020BF2E13|nr:DUF3488 and transglutaminase-like domain-containing protein [Methylonatrum kenyense]MCK8515769.1 DUF3488 and transglutaminase-like domain-containing protein [Methylonatrum kenyense]
MIWRRSDSAHPAAVTHLLPHRTLALLLLTLSAVALPHAVRLPVWITAGFVACALWRYLVARRGLRLPHRGLLLLATVAATGGIYLEYGTLLGLDAGVAILSAMLGLKLLELRRRRDTNVAIYLGYFLIVTQLLYVQSLPMFGYMLLLVWAMTTLLISANRPGGGAAPLEHGRLAATMLLQAMPIMLVIFLLFPRLPGPLWSMPDTDQTATSGLSEEMEPGSISELSLSDAVAFRVEFEDAPPQPRERYWRGPVLPDYDGRQWRQPEESDPALPVMEPLAGEIRYTVTLEPHNRHWLIALDMPLQMDVSARVNSEYHVTSEQRISSRLRYTATSARNYRLGAELRDDTLARYRELPDDSHPRARELARDWQQQDDAPDAVIQAVLEHFAEQPFHYTLQPPLMPDDAVDEFLFDHQRGFCEHYAGAFTVLMRAAGIPARVVTGYQGGEINPSGGYMIVRQSDAHAWSEVFIEGEGWRRVDPTAWVAPERIELGLAEALEDTTGLSALSRREAGWTRTLQLRWDALNAAWDRWVLGYGPNLQQELLQRLGLAGWRDALLAMTGAIVLLLVLIALLLFWPRTGRTADPAVRAWNRFCGKLAARGLPRQPQEGPIDYARRVAEARPELAEEVQRIAQRYVASRYQAPDRDANHQAALERAVAAFRPRAKRQKA